VPSRASGAESDCYARAMTDTARYIFVNGCDGSPLHGLGADITWIDTDIDDLTEEEAREHACELSLRLGGYLVSAKRVKEVFRVQHFEGRFVDGFGDPIPRKKLPEGFRE
jgi:hypothetical protein